MLQLFLACGQHSNRRQAGFGSGVVVAHPCSRVIFLEMHSSSALKSSAELVSGTRPCAKSPPEMHLTPQEVPRHYGLWLPQGTSQEVGKRFEGIVWACSLSAPLTALGRSTLGFLAPGRSPKVPPLVPGGSGCFHLSCASSSSPSHFGYLWNSPSLSQDCLLQCSSLIPRPTKCLWIWA